MLKFGNWAASLVVVIVLLSALPFNVILNINAQLFMQSGRPIINSNNATQVQEQIQLLQQHLAQLHVSKLKQQQMIEAKLLAPVLARDKADNCATDQHTPTDYKTYLTHFSCGHVSAYQNGTVLRKYLLIASDYNGTGKPIPISLNKTDPVIFHAWTFNGSLPGPTLRMTQGDHIQITVANNKSSALIHSFHMHSIHNGTMDGVMSASGMIFPGGSFTYDFIADPAGVYPYHCHMVPIEEHISRGLYGMAIIDPVTPRPQAQEMVMTLGAYSFTFQGINGTGHFPEPGTSNVPPTMQEMRKNLTDAIAARDEGNGPDNTFYFVNGMPFGYIGKGSIHLVTNQPYRIYLLNMVEFDPVNSFHMHGTMFYFTESGTPQSAKVYTDILTIAQADRGIVEFTYPYPGEFMFHSHIAHFSDLGWVGFFNVTSANGIGQKIN